MTTFQPPSIDQRITAMLREDSGRIPVVVGLCGAGRTSLLHRLAGTLGPLEAQYVNVERTATTPERFLAALTASSPFVDAGQAPRALSPRQAFDAVLAWDYLDFLGPGEARDFSRDLQRIVKPGGIVMAYFTSREGERREPHRRFRILGADRIEWAPLGVSRSLRHVYQNRDIERMFEGFRTHFAVVMQNGSREILLEKRAEPRASARRSPAAG